MLNDNLIYIILIAVVALVALTVNYVITTREQQEDAKDKRLTWLKGQAEHILHAIAVLREANCKPEIVQKINEHATSLLEEVSMLAPDSELFNSLSQQKDASDKAYASPEAFASDKSLKRAQIYINFAEKLVIQLAKGGKITLTLARSYQQELYWLRITVVVDAHISQGDKFKSTEDMMTALSHYRHAKALLVRANIPHNIKRPRLDSVDEMINQIQPKRTRSTGTLSDSMDRFL
ncbi:DNA topoisomerase I [uncultured Neptuniibacter sp.]|uniref:DNA topoisomerase I n=1 Tax=uncultured Neptuniibacter sp. TaxID=502143 RepID=UPI00261DE775|nr:DNA topoisomerase I [uncultured Neptuniibacter sp.]